MRTITIIVFLGIMNGIGFGQDKETDALFIKKIHSNILSKGKCHDNLRILCKDIGHRLSGTDGYDRASTYVGELLDNIDNVNISMQKCEVKLWDRGMPEKVFITTKEGQKITLDALALGGSVGTGVKGLSGQVIEVRSLDEVRSLGPDKISGKIVFYNRPMDPTNTNTFRSYGGAVDQRVHGATTAAEYGAIASLTRSMTVNIDDVPHTGTLFYRDEFPKIPGLAISTMDADLLSNALSQGNVTATIINSSQPGGTGYCNTVIGEIKGSEFPEQIILVGGHLDSWDVGEGAHDDGTGVIQSIEVFRALVDLGYKPKRTLRCVLFANEENGLIGGREYARISNEKGEYHLAAIESDRGGFIPKGFTFEGHEDTFKEMYSAVSQWADLFEAYGILFSNGGSGADIGPLKGQKGLLAGLSPDTQRYFDYHHTHNDTFEAVNKRELELGAAAMASLVYLIDKYGLSN